MIALKVACVAASVGNPMLAFFAVAVANDAKRADDLSRRRSAFSVAGFLVVVAGCILALVVLS